VVIASFGAATAFWLNGASFLAVIGSLLAVRARQVRKTGASRPLVEFLEGLRFVRRQPRIQELLALSVLMTFFGISAMTILPAVTTEALRGRADVLGLLMGASGAGALVGVLFLVPVVQQLRRPGPVIGSAAVWAGIWLTLFSLSRWLPFSALAMLANGAAFPVVLTTANGLVQLMAPADMRGRLLTSLLMVTLGTQPLAALAVGYLAQVVGPIRAVEVNGLLMALGAVAVLALRPGLRYWDVSPAPALMGATAEAVPAQREPARADAPA
jgi:hypothetical protein